MDTLELLNIFKNKNASLYQVQVLLDVVSAYFDVPLRLISPKAEQIIQDALGDTLIERYKEYKKSTSENKKEIEIEIFKTIKKIDDNYLCDVLNKVYLNKSSNNSSLSFRLELHKEWRVLKLLEDYIVLSENSNKIDYKPIEYITDDFFVFLKYWKHLDAHLVCGPFLRINNKSTLSNEAAIKKFIDFILPIIKNNNEIYPSYGEFLKLGSEFFSCSEGTAQKQTALAYDSLSIALSIYISKKTPAYFQIDEDYPVLGKRNWMFFSFSAIFISRYLKVGPSNKILSLFHSYEDNDKQVKCAQLITIINKKKLESIEYSACQGNQSKYLQLDIVSDNGSYFTKVRKRIAEFIYKPNGLDEKTRKEMWEQSFISVIKQSEKRISAISNKRIIILEEYLSNNWQKYLINDKDLSQNICNWINTIIRGVETFLYEYSYKKNRLTGYATSSGFKHKKLIDEGLNDINALDTGQRSLCSIVYRCIYKENRQYVHYQPLGKSRTSINEGNNSFFRAIDNAQSSIAHTLTYNSRSLGVIEIQGDAPYYFRHSNLYKLRQFATFFGDYYYRAKANKWLQDIIDSASNDNYQIAYHAQCEALTNLFLAAGAGIWICDPSIKDAYQLKGFFGSTKINELLEIEPHGNFFKENSNSEGAIFLRMRKQKKDKDSFFISKPYTPTNNANAYKQVLKDEKFDHILLFAINDINNLDKKKPHAIVTIHNKTQTHNDEYPETWGRDIAHISKFIASAFSIMHSVSEEKRKRILLLSHDLRTNIGQLENNAINMLSKVNKSNVSDKNKIKYINFVVKNDLQPIVEEAIQQIEALSGGDKSTAKEAFFDDIQRQKDEYLKLPQHRQFSNFREAYNTAFENREKERTVAFKPLWKDHDWVIRVSMSHLNKILINLIQNAQKYSSATTIVEPKIYEEYGALVFELKNRGKLMQSEEESFQVFNYKFRGTNGADMDGEGLGLWQVKQIVELYNASLFFDYCELSNVKLAEYIIRIQFYDYK